MWELLPSLVGLLAHDLAQRLAQLEHRLFSVSEKKNSTTIATPQK
jgi:hypothetical protein